MTWTLRAHRFGSLRLVLGIALCLACVAAAFSEERVAVVDEQGRAVAEGRAWCSDPAGEAEGGVGGLAVREGCREVACDAPGFLPGRAPVPEPVEGPIRCVVRPALRLAVEAPGPPTPETLLVSAQGHGGPAPDPGEPVTEHPLAAPPDGGVPSAELGEMKPGAYVLRVVSPQSGWRCSARTGPLAAGRVEIQVDWRDPALADGVVIGPDGAPRGGVPVVAHEGPPPGDGAGGPASSGAGRWRCAPLEGPAEATTDEGGGFSVPVDPGRKTLLVAGSWEDPAGVAARLVSSPGREPLRMVPRQPATVRATLLHEDDAPASCRAELRVEDSRAAWLTDVLGGGLEAECDRDGRVELGPFPPAPVMARFFPEQGLPLLQRLDTPSPGELLDLGVLRVPRGEEVEVTVVDPAGAPIEGAEVLVRGRSAIVLHVSGETGPEGKVALSGLPAGSRFRVEASADGFLTARRQLTRDDFPYEIALEEGAGIAGEVVDGEGEPLADAEVRIRGRDGNRSRAVSTDRHGRFEAAGVPPGVVTVSAEAPGYRLTKAVSVETETGEWTEGLLLEMEPEPLLRGRVLDGAGQAIRRAEVLLVERWDVESLDPARALATARTDATGGFSLARTDTSHVVLVARAPGYGAAADRAPFSHGGEPVTLTLPEAASARVHLPSLGAFEATIQLVDGAGVGQLRHIALRGAQERRSVRFDDLSPGRARAQLLPGPTETARLEAGVETEIWLETGAVVEGRIVHDARPVPRAVINAARQGGEKIRFGQLRYSDQDGRFRFEGLDPGSYLIVAESEHGRAEQPVQLSAGDRREVRLEVQRIALRVLARDAATKAPLAGASVRLSWTGFEGEASLHGIVAFPRDDLGFDMVVNNFSGDTETTGSSGLALLTVPREGEFRLSVDREGYEDASRTLELSRGETAVEVSLEPSSGASLRVELLTDPPGRRGSVLVLGPNLQRHAYTSSEALFDELRPGPYEVVFFVEGYGAGYERVSVSGSGETTAEVEARRGGTLIVPVEGADAARPAVVDGQGVDWSRLLARVSFPGQEIVQLEERPNVGPVWVFPGLPPGTYQVVVDGEERQPVPLQAGGVATAW
jgi:hypothetical protein